MSALIAYLAHASRFLAGGIYFLSPAGAPLSHFSVMSQAPQSVPPPQNPPAPATSLSPGELLLIPERLL